MIGSASLPSAGATAYTRRTLEKSIMTCDAFLKIATIPGESTDVKFNRWIEILSFNHGVTQPGSGNVSIAAGRTSSRVDHSDFVVVKAVDKTSPKLALACCHGEHISDVTLTFIRAEVGRSVSIEYKMSDVIVRAVSAYIASAGQAPLEQVSFAYCRITWKYTESDGSGGKPIGEVKTYWDLASNKGS